jgi:hypothetical protein
MTFHDFPIFQGTTTRYPPVIKHGSGDASFMLGFPSKPHWSSLFVGEFPGQPRFQRLAVQEHSCSMLQWAWRYHAQSEFLRESFNIERPDVSWPAIFWAMEHYHILYIYYIIFNLAVKFPLGSGTHLNIILLVIPPIMSCRIKTSDISNWYFTYHYNIPFINI